MFFQYKSKVYNSEQNFHCRLILLLQSVDGSLKWGMNKYNFSDTQLS